MSTGEGVYVSERMSNAPIYYALAQASFNPIAAMSKYVDQIQDSLRLKGYTLFETRLVQQLSPPSPDQAPQAVLQVTPVPVWFITRNDRTSGFVLTPVGIIYHTTRYETHNEFIQELLEGLMTVHEAVTLDHVSRLGLRYLDAVLPRAGESVEAYLAPGLHGIEFRAKERYSLTESVFETSPGPLVTTGTLVARVVRTTGPLGFPPDLQLNNLVMNPKFNTTESRAHAVIDTDHFVQGRMPVDTEGLREELLSLHAAVKSVFEVMTTTHARAAWA